MRSWVPLLAPVLGAALLLAGCSENVQPIKLTPVPSSPRPSTTATTAPPPKGPPEAGAPVGDVIAWIAAGEPADDAGFHTATRDGTETPLGEDVAFVTPSGKTHCMTDSKTADGTLACLVKLTNPPPRPAGAEGEWRGDWVDFDGQSLSVGSLHGDPGAFVYGDGAQLPYGQTLKFGDFQCRVDEVGLYCADVGHQSAVRYNAAGIEPFGCLTSVTPPADIGLKFSC